LKNALVKDPLDVIKKANKNPIKFWEEAARELEWEKPFTNVLDDSQAPFYKWYTDGKCNIVHNVLDRHMGTPVEKKVAILWESDEGKKKKLTYKQLNSEVCKMANGLKSLGIKKGDRVALYKQNTPEIAISMLACAKIGAVHSVVYAGFSSHALAERMKDQRAKILITSDIGHRRGKTIDMKSLCDEALEECPSVKHMIVHQFGSE